MPRQKFRAKYGKNYNKKGKKFSGNKAKSGKKSTESVSRDVKKFKYIRRNQENEETLRRQQQLEQNYRERNATSNNPLLGGADLSSDSGGSDDENDGEGTSLEQLLSTFHAAGGYASATDKVIESDDDEEEDEDDDSDDDNNDGNADTDSNDASDTNDDIFKFEEQSKPRGRKYRSSDDEKDDNSVKSVGSDDEDDDANDMEADASQSILRPEEFENKGHFDDSIENENDSEESDESEPELEEHDDSDNEDPSNESIADKFQLHLAYELSPQLLESMNDTHQSKKEILNWPVLGRIQVEIPTAGDEPPSDPSDAPAAKKKKKKMKTLLDDDTVYATEGTVPAATDISGRPSDFEQANVKVQLRSNIAAANKSNLVNGSAADGSILTNLQCELFSIMNNYQDLFYPHRNHANGEEIRFIYTLHAVNHIMKTRTKVQNHNLKLKMLANADSKSAAIIPDKYRDQGLFRPKVLIMVPFRESALRIVKILVALMFPGGGATTTTEAAATAAGAKPQIMHYKRFLDEYGGETLHFPKKNPKPEDYELTFAGNSDDTFRLGIKFTRKSIKLYSDFYSSDILIVSPLGLRMIVGAPGDKERDYDFLASIELLILDQADLFLAQNWDHLLHVLDHLHLQPQVSHLAITLLCLN